MDINLKEGAGGAPTNPPYPQPQEPEVVENRAKMGVVYFKDNGEIYTVVWGNDTLQTIYGPRASTFGQIVDVLSIEPNDYIFNRLEDFTVDISDIHAPQIVIKQEKLQLYNIFLASKPQSTTEEGAK